ncbi:hypothetical protein Mgra_00006345 [Meloidogyne graminicola]|uniref:Uncharacterized protein n=1 Tax=Meloidogyne graminicola TaxID=189291 RepID=A0A8S9ZLC0_9BILA|nr:hypothetical protein Mgra_00006345 [Meloidogyne graminicola]
MDVLNRLISRTNSNSSGKGFERLSQTCKSNVEQKQQKNCKLGKLSWKCCKDNLANSGAIGNKETKKTKDNTLNCSFSEPNLNIQVLNNDPINTIQKQNFEYEEDFGIIFDGDRERLCDKSEKKEKECSSPKNLKIDILPQLSPSGAFQLVRDKLPGSKKTPNQAQSSTNESPHNIIVATSSAPSLLVKQLRKHAKITDVVGGSIKKSTNKTNSQTTCVDSFDKNKHKNKNRKNNSIDGQRLLMFEEGMAMD